MADGAESMSQQAYTIIKDRVLNGTYALDQKISIKELTEGLGIGRSPVGEALKRLQHEGLVTISPKSGNRIWNPTLTELEQLMAYRKMMGDWRAADVAGCAGPVGAPVDPVPSDG